MANRIKGITVEIGGDTTGLDKALKSVNTSIKSTQSALKDVNRLLKLDPSNTELLSQKQRLLKDAIAATKEKLDSLKVAQEQAKQQLENGELGQDKYDALQREIVETEEELRRLQQEAATTNTALSKIDVAGQKMETVGNSIAGAGKKMMGVTTVIGGVGVAAVKTAADFDSAMSQVAAVSGATGKDFDALRNKAREMGAKTKFSATEAAEAMNYMAMAGWKTEDMLDGIEGVMNLAAASGEDLAATSDIVTDALTAFGLSAKDSGHFADILAAASSNANTNVSMMGETFKYCAPIAGALGFSAEDTAEAIGLMANAGIKSSQAGTALRTIMNNLAGDVKISGKAIGDVTIATTNADSSMRDLSDILADCRSAFGNLTESEKAQAAESLVGKNAMSGFLALMNAAVTTPVNAIKSTVTTVFNSVKSTVTSIFNGIKSTATSVWNGIKTAITTPIEAAKNKVKSVVDAIKGFFSGMKISLPHIKLPHFKVTGKLSISPPSVPHLSIDWYKEGGIMTSPTIFGMNGSSLMAGGEAGAEAILPLAGFYKQLESMISSHLNTSAMEKYLAVIADNSSKGIYLEDGTLVGHLLPAIDGELGKTQKLQRRLSL